MSGDRKSNSRFSIQFRQAKRSANKVRSCALHPSKSLSSFVESHRFQGVSGHDAIKFQVLIHRKGLSSMISQVHPALQVFRTLTFYKSKNIH